MSANARAQESEENPEPPKSEEVLALEEKVRIAELNQQLAVAEQAIAESQKAIEKAKLDQKANEAATEKSIAEAKKDQITAERDLLKGPKELDLPTGEITADGEYIESIVLAQSSLKKASDALVLKLESTIKTKVIKALVSYSPSEANKIKAYNRYLAELSTLKDNIETANNDADLLLALPDPVKGVKPTNLSGIITAGYAAYGILETAAAIISTFKTTTTYTNAEIKFTDKRLFSVFAQALKEKHPSISLYAPHIIPILNEATDSKLIAIMAEIQKEVNTASESIGKIEEKIKVLQKSAEEQDKEEDKKPFIDRIDNLNSSMSYLKALNTAFNGIKTTLYQTDDDEKISKLAGLLQAEAVSNLIDKEGTYIIYLEAVARGSNRVNKGWWKQTTLEHSAGAVLNADIASKEGEIIFSNTSSIYLDYTQAVGD